jgi:hypothetical protein
VFLAGYDYSQVLVFVATIADDGKQATENREEKRKIFFFLYNTFFILNS